MPHPRRCRSAGSTRHALPAGSPPPATDAILSGRFTDQLDCIAATRPLYRLEKHAGMIARFCMGMFATAEVFEVPSRAITVGVFYFSSLHSARLPDADWAEEGLAVWSRALVEAQAEALHCWYPEILRLHATNCRANGRMAEGRAALDKAVETDAGQGAAPWLLRASLGRIATGGSPYVPAAVIVRSPADADLPDWLRPDAFWWCRGAGHAPCPRPAGLAESDPGRFRGDRRARPGLPPDFRPRSDPALAHHPGAGQPHPGADRATWNSPPSARTTKWSAG